MTNYHELLPAVVDAAMQGGDRLLELFDPAARPVDRAAMYEAGMRIEAASLTAVRKALDGVRPEAGWFDDDVSGRAVPPGEWWIVDGAEGGVNHVHGLPEWAVTITLVKDRTPQLAVVRQPIGDLTYTAVKDAGAFLNGTRLRVSAKTSLDAAVVTASQAGGSTDVHARFGRALAAMSDHALLVRNTIPTTFPLLGLAAGQFDVFWQYEPDLPGTAAGTLLVTEAGGVATELSGQPWRPESPDVLVAAPGLHAKALDVLAVVPA
ncbi:inositol monophosphatase family protein [Actinophytocola oryzae]|uniref:Myo-inositol-1(Or 4)-monophosphatase n=1 Tax=Actinophytocola oryzae TaxID=502181 RepID=A0A4R7VB39_9PSEU|nr:inositol monophosphatase family protein [Actinophytocola oryzae]TDV46234.1 myo-inositol-1(or 4)-monophosphatase [Actinophytocola oryzae]